MHDLLMYAVTIVFFYLKLEQKNYGLHVICADPPFV